MTYSCKRCGYETNYKHVLVNHLQRKNTCGPILADIDTLLLISELKTIPTTSIQCRYCSRSFNDRSNKFKHERICVNKQGVPSSNVLHKLFDEINSLKKELSMMKSDKSRVTNITGNSVITTNNNIQNIVNVQLNPFEMERIDHLSSQELTDCMLSMETGFATLVKKIHFNKNVPENMNVRYKKSKKQNVIEVYENDSEQWVQHDADWVLDKILNKGYRLLFSHFIENLNNDVLVDRQETIQNFLAGIGAKRGNNFFGLKREVFILIKGNSGDRICLLSKNENDD